MGTGSDRLSRKPARKLTDREVAKIIGGTLGFLLDMSDPDTVKKAFQWTLEHWDVYVAMVTPPTGDPS